MSILSSLEQKRKLRVIGIMNGTSLDGVDFVLTEIRRPGAQPGKVRISYKADRSFAFPRALKIQLIRAAQHELKVNELSLLHHQLGRFYASCFRKLTPAMRKVDLIGLHGQTVFHQAPTATLQIGESSYLAAAARVPVVSDFRVSDLALGGQGAPIATLFHQIAFSSAKKETVSVHNLGGISNLSLVSAQGVKLAFDTGPANMMMDLLMQEKTKGKKHFDRDGRIALRGSADLEVVGSLLKNAYFKKAPPKSCGREEFGEILLRKFKQESRHLKFADQMATLLEWTAWSIALSYQKFVRPLPAKIIFCGGGAKNKALLQRLHALLPEVEMKTVEDLGWPASSIEGAAFGLLAAYRIWNWPSNFPRTTGAQRAVSMGKITLV